MTVSSRPRFCVDLALAKDATLELPAAASRHVQVLRRQPGDAIALFNGQDDLQWAAEIVAIGRKAVTVRVGEPLRVAHELPVRVRLAVGMPANERMDGLVEKATELGVAGLQPLVCERSVVRLSGERGEARRRHWQGVAAAACEQCGRVRVPAIAAPLKFDEWLRRFDVSVAPETALSGRYLLSAPRPAAARQASRGGQGNLGAARHFLESLDEQAESPTALLRQAADNAPAEIVVLSGPEGGLTPDEELLAQGRGFIALSLGPRVLRADTAPLALLAWLGIALRSEPP